MIAEREPRQVRRGQQVRREWTRRLWLRLARPFDLGSTGKLGIGPWTAVTR
ncbi:hypothetical protein ACFCX3_00220 [Streptomyces virginiae]|uniref:hypothetical protein n=1 Tax=Streptomyces virginiae TaxID=1961 RepID=UPI000A7ADB08